MAIVLVDDEFVVLDESPGLQDSGVAEANEDNNDEDISLASLNAAFSSRLFDAGGLALDDSFAAANGVAANDFISLTDGSTLTGFVKSNGDPLVAYDSTLPTDPTLGVLAGFTTVDGEAIYLFADVATGGGLGAFMFLGVDASGDIVIAGHLQADGTISTVQLEAISNPDSGDHDDPVDLSGLLDVAVSGTIEFDFDDLPSGNNLFATLGPSPDGPAIMIFGSEIDLKADGSSTNTGDVMFFSQAGPNATIGMNNQQFNPGDAAFFAYVNDVDANFLSGWPGGLDSTEADDADNALYTGGTLDVTSAKFTMAQFQGNDLGTLRLTTYLGAADTARDLLEGPTDGATSPNIMVVKVTVNGTTTTFDSDSDPAVGGVDVSGLGTPTVTIIGIDEGDAIEFITSSVHNRVLIEDLEGKFDIGGFVITQGVTSHVPVGDRIIFEDDGPAVGDGEGTPSLTVDDSDFADDDSASYASLFDVNFGTDGGNDADNDGTVDDGALTYTLNVSAAGADSGLVDTVSGEAVLLNLVGVDVVGTTAIGGEEVFRISVDAAGAVTLDQSRAVVHNDPDDPEEDTSPATLAADLITLTATATDDDLDTDDHTVDIGDTFNFEDDGPTMDLSTAEVPSLITDDTDITDSDSDDFSVLFSAVFGNDEEGDPAITYDLGVTGGPNADSGLVDTLSGEAVVLNLVAGEVIGTTALGGEEVLRISVDADGNVTLQQSRSVVHNDPDDPEEDSSPAKFSAANLVTLTATAFDGDDDHDDAVANIGLAFNFEDDGPTMDLSTAEVPSLITDDTDITDSDSADFSVLFSADSGNDGEGDPATTFVLGVTGGVDVDSGLVDTLSGDAVVLNLVAGEVIGTTALGGEEVLRISVDASGTVTLQQSRSVVHNDPDDPEEDTSPAQFSAANLVTLTATAFDGDDDHDDAVANIGLAFNFEDDGPTMDLSTAEVPSLITDDTDITDSDSADFSVLFSADSGNDGDGDATTYALGVTGGTDVDSGLVDTISNQAVVLNLVAGEVIGTTATGGDEVLRISVDASGNVTLQQSRAVVHNDPDDPEEDTSPAKFSAANLVTLTATAFDGDDDHDDAVANIGLAFNFEDDGPSIERNADPAPDLLVDETVFGSANADFSGLFSTLFGNDGPKDEDGDDLPDEDAITYALSISGQGDDTGLVDSLTGDAVVLDTDGLDIIGTVGLGGAEVFRVSADPDTGEVTLTQSRAVQHDDPLDPDEETSPAVLTASDLVHLTATAHDGDGDHDSVTIDIGGSLKFEDDGPALGPIDDDIVDFAVGQTASNLLGAATGADGASVSITDFTPSFDFGFTSVIGVQEDDKTVVYYEDEDGSGVIEAGEDNAFFQLSLIDTDADPANWNYLFEVLADPAPNTIEFDFDDLPSGANLFGVVGESATDPAIIVFGKNAILKPDGTYTNKSDVINTSQGGTGATIGVNNQMFDPNEGAFFVYVDDPDPRYLSGVVGGLNQTEADDADNVLYTGGTVDVHTASATISQIQAGNKASASMKITTWLGDADTARDLVLDPDTGVQPNIVTVRVMLTDGTTYEFDADADPAISGIDVSGIGTKTVTVVGLKKGYTVEWDTDGLHNRALIENVAGKFDIGKFAIGETTTTPDAELNFEVTIEDFDANGDTAVSDFTIGIDGNDDGIITL